MLTAAETKAVSYPTVGYRLSPMQQGMLYNSLGARHTGVDIEQTYTDLSEELDMRAFRDAWDAIIERHAILRTVFRLGADGGARQWVRRPRPVDLQEIDWTGLERGEYEDAFRRFLRADRRRGFDLENGPLLRVFLVRFGPGTQRLVLSFHHLLMDGRALVVVLRELFEVYEGLAEGRSVELPEPPPYASYLAWLDTVDWTEAERFWRGYLDGYGAPLSLPMARPAEESDREGAGEVSITFTEEQSNRFSSVARRHLATLNTVVQGAWALLLSRYSGERDIVFGTVRHGRGIPVEGADEMVGLMINTIPVRVKVEGGETVGGWLRRLAAEAKECRPHELAPLERIQAWSGVPAGRPLFETLVNFQKPAWDAALRALGGNWADRHFAVCSQTSYPIAVDAYGGPPLMVRLFYDRRRFTDETMSRVLAHLETLIEAMMEDTTRTLDELPMLAVGEMARLIAMGVGQRCDLSDAACVHRQFESQAKRAPGRLAVEAAGRTITYGELNRLANRLARRLCAMGAGTDQLVGVCMDRSIEMVAAWLGAMKAGAAYVAMDPAQPVGRLVSLMRDSGARVLLADERRIQDLETEGASFRCFGTRADWESLADEPDADPEVPAGPRNLAYAIYTSGSTGEPKGVLIEHESLSNLVLWHRDAYRVTPADRASQLANPAFDAAVWEVWPYLASGASLHLVDDDTVLSPDGLVRWIAGHRITHAFVPTPVAELLLAEDWPKELALRELLTGGDRLVRRPPAGLPFRVINHYGPTECTVVATSSPVPPGDMAGAPPIGRPIANTIALVLDEQRRLVPVDVPGELYLGGAGVARSYLNRPDTTQERFVMGPFDAFGGVRCYRTGDRVRWRPDGELEFLGRLDEQIKIRGFRIEPGEVESALARHPAVRQAAVVGQSGRLWAALVASSMERPAPSELRAFVSRLLPDYMVPGGFLWLDELPLTTRGKLDRAALSCLIVGPERRDSPAAPCSLREKSLVDIWGSVLSVTPIGVHDDFFELGGHSLLAAQVVARIQAETGVRLPLRLLFEHPTIAELAVEMERLGSAEALPILRRRNRTQAESEGLEAVEND